MVPVDQWVLLDLAARQDLLDLQALAHLDPVDPLVLLEYQWLDRLGLQVLVVQPVWEHQALQALQDHQDPVVLPDPWVVLDRVGHLVRQEQELQDHQALPDQVARPVLEQADLVARLVLPVLDLPVRVVHQAQSVIQDRQAQADLLVPQVHQVILVKLVQVGHLVQ